MLMDPKEPMPKLAKDFMSNFPLTRFCREAAEASLPPAVVLERVVEALRVEVGPKAIAEVQLRKRAFPEQEIAEAPFVAGADQQVDFPCGIGAMIDFVQQA